MEQKTASRTGRTWQQRDALPGAPPLPVGATTPKPAPTAATEETANPVAPAATEEPDSSSAATWAVVDDDLVVTWDSQEAFSQEWKTHLNKSTLQPPPDLELPKAKAMRIHLHLPNETQLTVRGSCRGTDTIQLKISFALRNKLKKALG